MKRILGYLKPQKMRVILGMIIKFVGTIMDLFLPWILSFVLDEVVPKKDIGLIWWWGLLMLVASVIALLGNVIANRMASLVAKNATGRVRYDLFSRISYLSSKQIDDFTIPSLVTRLTTDTYNVHQMFGMMQRIGIRAPILLLGGIGMTFTLNVTLAFILVAILPLLGVVVYFVSKKGIPLYSKVQKSADRVVSIVLENITGIRIIKALSKTNYEKRRFDKANDDLTDREKKAGRVMAVTNPVMNMLLNIGLTLVILVGAFLVDGGTMLPGKIIAFLTYFTIILTALMNVSRLFTMYSRASASAQRITEVLETPQDLKLMPKNHKDSPYHIEFNNVSFSYLKKENNVQNINFCLKKGETLGIIGATGCGKTTIIQLLMRFYDVDGGEIRINGDDVRGIPPEELHTRFGIAFQNDVLFAQTVAENIEFGRGLNEKQMALAAANAQAKEFIDGLPDHFGHKLSIKGSNLSGGQKQRLIISRALASNPEILILDDSSSALDYATDAKLRKAINKHYSGTTSIVIAQRISSILHSDLILVMDDGKIIGAGKHEELLKSCESYAEISKSQMGDEENANGVK